MINGSLWNAMEAEHTKGPDAKLAFTSPNGLKSSSQLEWEVVVNPTPDKVYPEREGLAESHPDWCRKAMSLAELKGMMHEQNKRLLDLGHAALIIEEVASGRLYTGPLYHKYNTVLRSKSGAEEIELRWLDLCKGNEYPTTIHAINSCVIKLSKLTMATKACAPCATHSP